MGRAPCCDKASVKKGPWSPEEDAKLKDYIHKFGTGGNWIALPHKAGLKRCGKSCRLRWLNYLRPNIKHGDFSLEEDRIICSLFATIGSRWSIIAAQLPGRTDNDIKNYWNTKLKKKLMGMATSHSKKAHHDPTTSVTTSSVYHHNHHPLLHRPPPSPALSSTSPYHYYNSPSSTLSFSTLENSISTPTLLPNSTIQDGFFNTNIPIQEQHYHVVKDNNTLLMFGGLNTNTNMNTNIDCDHQQPSCSSSDASNTTTNTSRQFIRSEVIDYDQDHHQGVNLMQNYNPSLNFYNNGQINGQEQEEIKKNISNVNVNEFCSDQSQLLDYGLEEIKQLISINSTNNQSFFFDENKTNEMNNNRILYY